MLPDCDGGESEENGAGGVGVSGNESDDSGGGGGAHWIGKSGSCRILRNPSQPGNELPTTK